MAAKGRSKDLQTKKPTEIIGKQSSGEKMHPLATLRNRLIDHILNLKKIDEDYARWALKNYETMFPELELIKGVREKLNEIRPKG